MIKAWFKKWFSNVTPLQPMTYDVIPCTMCKWCSKASNEVYYCIRPNGKFEQNVDIEKGIVTITASTEHLSCYYERNNVYDSASEIVLCGTSGKYFKHKE